MKIAGVAALISIGPILAACVEPSDATQAPSNETAVPTSRPTNTTTPTATDYPTWTPYPTATPSGALNETGPVLLFNMEGQDRNYVSHLYAMNPDGSGLTALVDDIAQFYAVSPDSQWGANTTIAYVSHGNNAAAITVGTQLKLLNLPSGTEIGLSFLSGHDSDNVQLHYLWRALRANGLAWSHDGSRIAFVSSLDNDFSDIFVISLDTGETIRLTALTEYAAQIEWSPDDEYILYGSYPVFENHTDGYYSTWAIKSNGTSTPIMLQGIGPNPIIYDWFDDQTVILGMLDGSGSSPRIELVYVPTGSSTLLVEGDFNSPAYNKDDRVFLLPQGDETCAESNWELLYLSGARRTLPFKACDDFPDWVEHTDSFVALPSIPSSYYNYQSDGRLILTSYTGDVTMLNNPLPYFPFVAIHASPDGRYWAWEGYAMGEIDSPFWVSDGTDNFRNLLPDQAWRIGTVIWAPDSQTVFFGAINASQESYLFKASAPDFEAEVILGNHTLGYPGIHMEWVP